MVISPRNSSQCLQSDLFLQGVRGIPSDRLNKILRAIESAREHKRKQEPDMQQIREYLERQVSFRIEEKSSYNRTVSSPHLPPEG